MNVLASSDLNTMGVDLPELATTLARAQEWGIMVGCLLFVGVVTLLLIWLVFSFSRRVVALYDKAVDANRQLADSIDKMRDEVSESNKKLQQYLENNLNKVAQAIKVIARDLEIQKKTPGNHRN